MRTTSNVLVIGLATFVLVLAGASSAAAQVTTVEASASCPNPPCMVLVPQEPVQAQVYVTSTPVQQAAPQPQMVEVTSTRLRTALVIPGAIMLGVSWVINVLVGSIVGLVGRSFGDENAQNYFGFSLIPILGPFLQLTRFNFDLESGLLAYHVVLGLVQTAGFLMALFGTVFPEETTELRYADAERDEQGPQWAVLPWATQTGGGLSLTVAGF